MYVFCSDCGHREEFVATRYCCDCSGAWETIEQVSFDPAQIDPMAPGLWRYGHLFGLDFTSPAVTLGAGWTPLVSLDLFEREVLCKLEYLAPSGSFKDRGTEVMINTLLAQGVTRIAEDSSGNAGASIAAYAARAGIIAEIYVPAYASPAKQAQIAVYGAEVHPVEGARINAKHAAIRAIERGVTLATHAYHPAFLLGQQSVGWEVWEQLGRRAPDWYVVPVGQGLHLLGFWLAMRRLQAAGLIERMPHLVAVQAARLAPVCAAFKQGLDTVPGVEPPAQASAAEGLAISEPVRGRRIMQALRETGGICVSVGEDAIKEAQQTAAQRGLYIEPTSATVVAALPQVFRQAAPGDQVVVALTGSGLKGSPRL